MTNVPLPAMVAVWPADFVWPSTVNCVTVSASASMSESFVRTLPVAALSSLAEPVSLVPTGASLTAVTDSVSVEVLVRAPSDSV